MMLISKTVLCLALSVSNTLAAPYYWFPTQSFKPEVCSVSNVKLSLPSGQTQLVVPKGAKPKFIAIGVGVQNYTCSATGTFGSIGALATLFDASCIASNQTLLAALPQALFQSASTAPDTLSYIARSHLLLGQHLFVTNPITHNGTVAKFDLSSSQHRSTAFFDGTKVGDIKAPTASDTNVDWLMLSRVNGSEKVVGDLATTVFRVMTVGGQPPTSCSGATATSIPYAAHYWFF